MPHTTVRRTSAATLALILAAACLGSAQPAPDPLRDGFRNPPNGAPAF